MLLDFPVSSLSEFLETLVAQLLQLYRSPGPLIFCCHSCPSPFFLVSLGSVTGDCCWLTWCVLRVVGPRTEPSSLVWPCESLTLVFRVYYNLVLLFQPFSILCIILKKNPKQDIWFSREFCSFFLTYQVIRFVTELLATSLSGYKCAFFFFSENYLELENCGPTDVKWHLSSFAPPYVKVSHLNCGLFQTPNTSAG